MSKVPLTVDPFRCAEQGMRLQGVFSYEDMPRLTPSLLSHQGETEVDLVFGQDEQGLVFLKGQVSAALPLQCQRCMEPMSYPVKNKFLFALIASEEEAEDLPEKYDPVIVTQNTLSLVELVEDELILSLPIVPAHPQTECKAKLPFSMIESAQSAEVKTESPFKVIEFLKSKRD